MELVKKKNVSKLISRNEKEFDKFNLKTQAEQGRKQVGQIVCLKEEIVDVKNKWIIAIDHCVDLQEELEEKIEEITFLKDTINTKNNQLDMCLEEIGNVDKEKQKKYEDLIKKQDEITFKSIVPLKSNKRKSTLSKVLSKMYNWTPEECDYILALHKIEDMNNDLPD